MSTFNFGRAFNEAFQGALSRAQQRRARRASNRIRRRRIAERARRFNQRQNQNQKQFEARQDLQRDQLGFQKRKFNERNAVRRLNTFMDLRQALKADPTTIEVKRQNFSQLPGEGPVEVGVGTLMRHAPDGQEGNGSADGGGAPTSGVSPSTPQEARQVLKDRVRQEQAAGEAGVPKDSLASIQEDIRAAKTALDSMTTGRPDFTELRQQAMGDTTDAPADTADTAEPTSRADTTQTRGLGGRPDGAFVKPQELGMTTGGVGGGGAADPSSSIMALRAQAMGAADVGEVDDSTLVDRAFGVAVQRSPQEAKQRLDGLVQQGHLDSARRDSIVQEMERKRQAAFDGLQGLRGGQ